MKISNVALIIHRTISLAWQMYYTTCKTYIWLIFPKDDRNHEKTYIFSWPLSLSLVSFFFVCLFVSLFANFLIFLFLIVTLLLLCGVLINYQIAFFNHHSAIMKSIYSVFGIKFLHIKHFVRHLVPCLGLLLVFCVSLQVLVSKNYISSSGFTCPVHPEYI